MADVKEKALALLSSTAGVDMKTVGATTLYTVPIAKVGRISHIVIRDPSASMAGGSDYDFTQWKQLLICQVSQRWARIILYLMVITRNIQS